MNLFTLSLYVLKIPCTYLAYMYELIRMSLYSFHFIFSRHWNWKSVLCMFNLIITYAYLEFWRRSINIKLFFTKFLIIRAAARKYCTRSLVRFSNWAWKYGLIWIQAVLQRDPFSPVGCYRINPQKLPSALLTIERRNEDIKWHSLNICCWVCFSTFIQVLAKRFIRRV
jgi:hypothetical protein